MGGQPGPDDPEPAGSQGAGTQPWPDAFRANFAAIRKVLKVLDDVEQTPDLLDRQSGEMAGVTEAERLFTLARRCWVTVRAARAELNAEGWAVNAETRFEESFRELVDGWAAYKSLLPFLRDVGWSGGGPTPGQVQTDLKVPRRAFITALELYSAQLLTVQQYLPDTGVTPTS